MAEKKNLGGRPQIPIDWTEFDKLCHIQATQVEIADWFNCSVDTIDKRIKDTFGIGFTEYYRQKKGRGKISLRRSQFQAATGPNPSNAMMIWLGKQYLGQSDQQNIDGNFKIDKAFDTKKMSKEEYKEFVAAQLKKKSDD